MCKACLLMVNVEIKAQEYFFVNIYTPGIDGEKVFLYNSLQKELSQISQDAVLVLGVSGIGKVTVYCNRTGQEIQDLSVLIKVVPVNLWREKCPLKNTFWVHLG